METVLGMPLADSERPSAAGRNSRTSPRSASISPSAADVETAAYRIVQEALANAIRHAGA